MAPMNIDLSQDPEIPRGRDLIEELAGAHMSARSEEELQLFVRHSMDDAFSESPKVALRVMVHAAYRGQALLVRLLSLAARQRMALENAGVAVDPGLRQREPDRFQSARIDIWAEVRDDAEFSHN